jgi:hypothetical protein
MLKVPRTAARMGASMPEVCQGGRPALKRQARILKDPE